MITLKVRLGDDSVDPSLWPTKSMRFPNVLSASEATLQIRQDTGHGGRDYGLVVYVDSVANLGERDLKWMQPTQTFQALSVVNDTEVYYQKRHKTITINTLDGATMRLLLDTSTPLFDLMPEICAKVGISSPEEWTLRTEDRWLFSRTNLLENNVDARNDELQLRKRWWTHDALTVGEEEPRHLRLLYCECKEYVVAGHFGCTPDEAISFAALCLQMEHGDFDASAYHVDPVSDPKGGKRLIPFSPDAHMAPVHRPKKKKALRKLYKAVASEWEALQGMEAMQAANNYVKLSRSLEMYGTSSFDIHLRCGKKGDKILLHKLFINTRRVWVVDDEAKKVRMEWPFKALKQYTAYMAQSQLRLVFASDSPSGERLEAEMEDPSLVAHLIAGYVDIFHKRRKDGAYEEEIEDKPKLVVLEDFSPEWDTAHESDSVVFTVDGSVGQVGEQSMTGEGASSATSGSSSGQVKVTNMASAASAARIFVDQLSVPMRSGALLGSPDDLKDSLLRLAHGLGSAVSDMVDSMGGNEEARDMQGRRVAVQLKGLIDVTRSAAAVTGNQALLDAGRRLAEAVAGIVGATNGLLGNPNDFASQSALRSQMQALEDSRVYLAGAVRSGLADDASYQLLVAAAKQAADAARLVGMHANATVKRSPSAQTPAAGSARTAARDVVLAGMQLHASSTIVGRLADAETRSRVTQQGMHLIGLSQQLVTQVESLAGPDADLSGLKGAAGVLSAAVFQLRGVAGCVATLEQSERQSISFALRQMHQSCQALLESNADATLIATHARSMRQSLAELQRATRAATRAGTSIVDVEARRGGVGAQALVDKGGSGSGAGLAIKRPTWVGMHDFAAERPDCLSFSKGDLLYVLEQKDDAGWWRVANGHGQVGLVPSNYISVVPEAQVAPTSHFVATGDFQAPRADCVTLKAGQVVRLEKQVHGDWWTITTAGGQQGLGPAVTLVPASAAAKDAQWNVANAAAQVAADTGDEGDAHSTQRNAFILSEAVESITSHASRLLAAAKVAGDEGADREGNIISLSTYRALLDPARDTLHSVQALLGDGEQWAAHDAARMRAKALAAAMALLSSLAKEALAVPSMRQRPERGEAFTACRNADAVVNVLVSQVQDADTKVRDLSAQQAFVASVRSHTTPVMQLLQQGDRVVAVLSEQGETEQARMLDRQTKATQEAWMALEQAMAFTESPAEAQKKGIQRRMAATDAILEGTALNAAVGNLDGGQDEDRNAAVAALSAAMTQVRDAVVALRAAAGAQDAVLAALTLMGSAWSAMGEACVAVVCATRSSEEQVSMVRSVQALGIELHNIVDRSPPVPSPLVSVRTASAPLDVNSAAKRVAQALQGVARVARGRYGGPECDKAVSELQQGVRAALVHALQGEQHVGQVGDAIAGVKQYALALQQRMRRIATVAVNKPEGLGPLVADVPASLAMPLVAPTAVLQAVARANPDVKGEAPAKLADALFTACASVIHHARSAHMSHSAHAAVTSGMAAVQAASTQLIRRAEALAPGRAAFEAARAALEQAQLALCAPAVAPEAAPDAGTSLTGLSQSRTALSSGVGKVCTIARQRPDQLGTGCRTLAVVVQQLAGHARYAMPTCTLVAPVAVAQDLVRHLGTVTAPADTVATVRNLGAGVPALSAAVGNPPELQAAFAKLMLATREAGKPGARPVIMAAAHDLVREQEVAVSSVPALQAPLAMERRVAAVVCSMRDFTDAAQSLSERPSDAMAAGALEEASREVRQALDALEVDSVGLWSGRRQAMDAVTALQATQADLSTQVVRQGLGLLQVPSSTTHASACSAVLRDAAAVAQVLRGDGLGANMEAQGQACGRVADHVASLCSHAVDACATLENTAVAERKVILDGTQASLLAAMAWATASAHLSGNPRDASLVAAEAQARNTLLTTLDTRVSQPLSGGAQLAQACAAAKEKLAAVAAGLPPSAPAPLAPAASADFGTRKLDIMRLARQLASSVQSLTNVADATTVATHGDATTTEGDESQITYLERMVGASEELGSIVVAAVPHAGATQGEPILTAFRGVLQHADHVVQIIASSSAKDGSPSSTQAAGLEARGRVTQSLAALVAAARRADATEHLYAQATSTMRQCKARLDAAAIVVSAGASASSKDDGSLQGAIKASEAAGAALVAACDALQVDTLGAQVDTVAKACVGYAAAAEALAALVPQADDAHVLLSRSANVLTAALRHSAALKAQLDARYAASQDTSNKGPDGASAAVVKQRVADAKAAVQRVCGSRLLAMRALLLLRQRVVQGAVVDAVVATADFDGDTDLGQLTGVRSGAALWRLDANEHWALAVAMDGHPTAPGWVPLAGTCSPWGAGMAPAEFVGGTVIKDCAKQSESMLQCKEGDRVAVLAPATAEGWVLAVPVGRSRHTFPTAYDVQSRMSGKGYVAATCLGVDTDASTLASLCRCVASAVLGLVTSCSAESTNATQLMVLEPALRLAFLVHNLQHVAERVGAGETSKGVLQAVSTVLEACQAVRHRDDWDTLDAVGAAADAVTPALDALMQHVRQLTADSGHGDESESPGLEVVHALSAAGTTLDAQSGALAQVELPQAQGSATSIIHPVHTAACAISSATRTVVSAVTETVQEMIEKAGRHARSDPFLREPKLAASLIAATRSVSGNMSLWTRAVTALCVPGGLSVPALNTLISTSRDAQDATRRLLAGTKAKADARSPSVARLTSAGAALRKANDAFLEAAKLALERQEAQNQSVELVPFADRIAVGELAEQMEIARLERELRVAQMTLQHVTGGASGSQWKSAQ